MRTWNFLVSLKTACIEGSLPKRQLFECSILWCTSVNTASAEDDQHLLLHRCLFSPAHRFSTCSVYERRTRRSTPKQNDKDRSEDNKTQCSAKLWNNSLCIAFLLIPALGKSGWTVFLMKIQTESIRTWSFVQFILLCICLQTCQFDAGFSERLKLKDDAVLNKLDPSPVAPHSNCVKSFLGLSHLKNIMLINTNKMYKYFHFFQLGL